MSRPRRLLTVLACAAGACALSAPAAPAAGKSVPSNGHGVVLSVSGRTARLVDRSHKVSDVHVTSAHGLRRGEVVTVRNGHARVTGRVGKVSFLGRVVKSSGHGAVVRLGDGSTLNVGGKPRAHRASASAASVTIDFQGLTAGQALLVTISTDGQGNVAITIKVLPSSTNIGDNELDVTGVVTDDTGGGEFAIRSDDGRGLRFQDPQQLLEAADASQCDEVEVGYHRDGGALVADTLRVTGQSSDGACGGDGSDNTTEVDGVVQSIASDGSSLTVQPDDGSPVTTIPVSDASLLDGIQVGDDVAVTLDDTNTAIDVEPIDNSGDPGSGDGGGD